MVTTSSAALTFMRTCPHHIEALQFRLNLSSEPLQCSFVLQISVSTANLWKVLYSWMMPTYSVVAFSLSMAFFKAW